MTGSTQETLDSSKLAACTSQVSYLHFMDFVWHVCCLICLFLWIHLFELFAWLTQEGKKKWSSSAEPTSTAMRRLTRRKWRFRWHHHNTGHTCRWQHVSVAVARWKMLWTAWNKCCQPSLQQCQYMIPHLVQKAGQSWLRHPGPLWRAFSKRIELNEFKLAWTTSFVLFPLFWVGWEAWRGTGKSCQKREDRMQWNTFSHKNDLGTCFRPGNFLCPSAATATGWSRGGKCNRSTFHLASMPAYANKPICELGSMGLGSHRVTCYTGS